MEDIKKLEQMIFENKTYDDIIEQSKKVDEWVNRKIGEAV